MKRILMLMLFVFVAFSVQSLSANYSDVAGEGSPKYVAALVFADQANDEIYELVLEAQIAAELNPELTDSIIAQLVEETLAVSNDAIVRIEGLGFDAECEWVPFEIGGVTVLIDPIRVHDW